MSATVYEMRYSDEKLVAFALRYLEQRRGFVPTAVDARCFSWPLATEELVLHLAVAVDTGLNYFASGELLRIARHRLSELDENAPTGTRTGGVPLSLYQLVYQLAKALESRL